MQLPSKSVIEKSLVRRKDGGQHESQTALKLAIMLMVSGVSIAMSTNSGAVRFATDAAADNRGEGPQDETMHYMSGRNSLMDRLMIQGDVWNDAQAYLTSLELTEKQLARERIGVGGGGGGWQLRRRHAAATRVPVPRIRVKVPFASNAVQSIFSSWRQRQWFSRRRVRGVGFGGGGGGCGCSWQSIWLRRLRLRLLKRRPP